MGFPINLPSGKGMTINYMLCIIALSCFFLAQVQHGGGGWSANVFFAFCKKRDRKKQQQGDCAEATKKTVQAMRYEW
jgi:hypothetical protein